MQGGFCFIVKYNQNIGLLLMDVLHLLKLCFRLIYDQLT